MPGYKPSLTVASLLAFLLLAPAAWAGDSASVWAPLPGLERPHYVSAAEADLDDSESVLGLDYKSLTAAYPEKTMAWLEVVNQEVDGELISLTYSPAWGAAAAFKGYRFASSASLFDSRLVLHDPVSDSLFAQSLGRGIAGEHLGRELERIPVEVTTWQEWRTLHPDTKVLAGMEMFRLAVRANPYSDLCRVADSWCLTGEELERVNSREIVWDLLQDDDYPAVIRNDLAPRQSPGLKLGLGEMDLKIKWDQGQGLKVGLVDNEDKGRGLEVYWFAWVGHTPLDDLMD